MQFRIVWPRLSWFTILLRLHCKRPLLHDVSRQLPARLPRGVSGTLPHETPALAADVDTNRHGRPEELRFFPALKAMPRRALLLGIVVFGCGSGSPSGSTLPPGPARFPLEIEPARVSVQRGAVIRF